jgi:hypothetical protein
VAKCNFILFFIFFKKIYVFFCHLPVTHVAKNQNFFLKEKRKKRIIDLFFFFFLFPIRIRYTYVYLTGFPTRAGVSGKIRAGSSSKSSSSRSGEIQSGFSFLVNVRSRLSFPGDEKKPPASFPHHHRPVFQPLPPPMKSNPKTH